MNLSADAARDIALAVSLAKKKLQQIIGHADSVYQLTYLDAIKQFLLHVKSKLCCSGLRHILLNEWGSDAEGSTQATNDLQHQLASHLLTPLMEVVDTILTLPHESMRMEALNRLLYCVDHASWDYCEPKEITTPAIEAAGPFANASVKLLGSDESNTSKSILPTKSKKAKTSKKLLKKKHSGKKKLDMNKRKKQKKEVQKKSKSKMSTRF